MDGIKVRGGEELLSGVMAISLHDFTEEEDQSTSEMILMNHMFYFIFLLSLIKE